MASLIPQRGMLPQMPPKYTPGSKSFAPMKPVNPGQYYPAVEGPGNPSWERRQGIGGQFTPPMGGVPNKMGMGMLQPINGAWDKAQQPSMGMGGPLDQFTPQYLDAMAKIKAAANEDMLRKEMMARQAQMSYDPALNDLRARIEQQQQATQAAQMQAVYEHEKWLATQRPGTPTMPGAIAKPAPLSPLPSKKPITKKPAPKKPILKKKV